MPTFRCLDGTNDCSYLEESGMEPVALHAESGKSSICCIGRGASIHKLIRIVSLQRPYELG